MHELTYAKWLLSTDLPAFQRTVAPSQCQGGQKNTRNVYENIHPNLVLVLLFVCSVSPYWVRGHATPERFEHGHVHCEIKAFNLHFWHFQLLISNSHSTLLICSPKLILGADQQMKHGAKDRFRWRQIVDTLCPARDEED